MDGVKSIFSLTADQLSFLLCFNIICFQETWAEKNIVFPNFIRNYNVFESYAVRSHPIGRAKGGIVTLVRKDLGEVKLLGCSRFFVFLVIRSLKMVVGNIYI